jgi:hypothetical protein
VYGETSTPTSRTSRRPESVPETRLIVTDARLRFFTRKVTEITAAQLVDTCRIPQAANAGAAGFDGT